MSEKADKAFTAYWLRRPEDHYIDLWTELQRGQISAWGMKPQEAEYSEIPPIQFEALRIRSCSNIGTFFAGDVYRLVRLDSAEVQRAFPLFGAKPQIRGRPPKYDWQEFHIQCRTVWEYHGSFNKHDPQFSRQADLVKIMAEWCVEKWGREPSLSQLKSEVAKFLAAMAEK